MAPPEDIPQLVVETATVPDPPPKATAPVELPVPMFTPKLELLFKLIAAAETVAPRFPVRSWVTVKAPFAVAVCPVRPIVTEVAFVPPKETVPTVPEAVPASIETAPELPPEAFPEAMLMPPVPPAMLAVLRARAPAELAPD